MHYATNEADNASNSTAQRVNYLGENPKGILRLQVETGIDPALYRLPPLGYNLAACTPAEIALLVEACTRKAAAVADHAATEYLRALNATTPSHVQLGLFGGSELPNATTYRLCPVCGHVATVEKSGWLNQLSLHIVREHPHHFHHVSPDSFRAITLPAWAIRPFVVVEHLQELPTPTRETTVARLRSLSRTTARLPRLSKRTDKVIPCDRIEWTEI